MTCQFHLTIPGDPDQTGNRSKCQETPTRSITGFHNNHLVITELCEEHYQTVSKWLENVE